MFNEFWANDEDAMTRPAKMNRGNIDRRTCADLS